MAISQHTPGPWNCEHAMTRELFVDNADWAEYLATNPPIVRITGPNGETVAAAHDLFEFSKPNADLIQAAPDLLEAMKGCLVDMEIFYSKHREPNNKYFAAFKAAIKKAEAR